MFLCTSYVSSNAPLRRMIEKDRMSSIILWGPPGTGKTTIARLLASTTNSHFESISAVFSGVADLRNVFNNAKNRREIGAGTILFVDEIHRMKSYVQESMYPAMEMDGIDYYVKPMNCPHHHKIYGAEPRSYRDLPLRLAEYVFAISDTMSFISSIISVVILSRTIASEHGYSN